MPSQDSLKERLSTSWNLRNLQHRNRADTRQHAAGRDEEQISTRDKRPQRQAARERRERCGNDEPDRRAWV
jgi:hypothetical protein